ncbi:LysR substrate-binding domain-containing protein [Novosphingobium sp.]|uniref:LysR substrate-binding domain-containing protein n=1 Tax=Novosphingobium sp. TaxID=1874826 RepID=UPI002FDD71FC
MILDIRYFHVAEAVAKWGSFRRAAKELGIDQATVSRRVHSLEDRLGIVLFDRSRAGARLTTLGAQFLIDAGPALAQLNKVVERIEMVRSESLQVGIVTGLNSKPLRDAIARLIKVNPKVTIKLHLGAPTEHVEGLRAGDIDIAFLPGDTYTVGFDFQTLWHESPVVVLPPSHPLAIKARIGWSDIASELFLFSRSGPDQNFSIFLVERLRRLGIEPKIELHGVTREDLINMVGLGFGVTVLCSSIDGAFYRNAVFKLIGDDQEGIAWSVAWSPQGKNKAVYNLVSALKSGFKNGYSDPNG